MNAKLNKDERQKIADVLRDAAEKNGDLLMHEVATDLESGALDVVLALKKNAEAAS